jgi:hypothetical protein
MNFNINFKKPASLNMRVPELRIRFVCGYQPLSLLKVFHLCFITSMMLLALPSWATSDDSQKVETAFIYQFTNYITWPQNLNKDAFNISVLGVSPLTQELEGLAKTKTVKGRKIEIQQITDVAQLKRSDIVMITSSNEKHLDEVLKKTRGTGTLIISASKGFAERGGMINFYIEDGRIRFEINRAAMEKEKLQASSQLLKLAKLIE